MNANIADWKHQLRNSIKSVEDLEKIIELSDEEREGIEVMKDSRWSITPYYASLMDPKDSNCPIRRQVIPSKQEKENIYGMSDYLLWKENRRGPEDGRPDSIGRQYKDRVAFTVTDVCGVYCRHCFRGELVVNKDLKLRFDVDEGINWIRNNPEVRDVLITGGDPLLLSDEKLDYLIRNLREIPHVQMIRIGSRLPVVLPQRITPGLKRVLGGFHKVPIWLNTQINHPREITQELAYAVYDLLSCGVNVGNQMVLLKGINDDKKTFKELHQKLLTVRVKPYYVFYCEPAPGMDHFRTTVEKGAELIRDCLRGHTTGLAQPMYVLATNVGKIPLMPDYYIQGKDDEYYTLRNHEGETTKIPVIPE